MFALGQKSVFFSEASRRFEILNHSILLATLTLVSFSAIHNTANSWHFPALLMQLEIINYCQSLQTFKFNLHNFKRKYNK